MIQLLKKAYNNPDWITDLETYPITVRIQLMHRITNEINMYHRFTKSKMYKIILQYTNT